MRRPAGKTHMLYQEVPWQRHARADCYHCGTRERVQKLHWLQNEHKEAYMALCMPCYSRHMQSDGVAAPDRLQEQVI